MREESIARILELHAEVKAAGVRVKLLSGERLKEHLAKQPYHMLGTIRRVYEDLLEEKRFGQGLRPQDLSKLG